MKEYHRANPFKAKLQERILLSHTASSKKTYHLSLNLSGSNITYQPGDAVGIYPQNPLSSVEVILKALKKTGKEKLLDPRTNTLMSLKHFLQTKANLLRITPSMLQQFPEMDALKGSDAKQERKHFIENHDLLDLFSQCGSQSHSLQTLIPHFSPLLPRFYSIASSQALTKESLDLLIVTFSHKQGGKVRSGLSSQFLCEHAKIMETPIPIYHHLAPHFKLPKDPTTPIIMIGPGTGVAPYRAFLQERLYQNAPGKNWLFFGERQKAFDFYYEDFLLNLEKQHFLRLDCAFSRDQEEKIYVQDLMKKEKKDIWQWIEQHAVVYICGDARHMAKDVIATLHSIAIDQGSFSDKQAETFIREMRREKRLLLDVY